MDRVHLRFLRYSAFYTPLLLTLSSPELGAEGIEATYDVVTPDRTIPDGIRSGEVDVAQSALAVSFRPALAGEAIPFVHFALLNDRDGFFLARRGGDGPFDWHDLEGRTIVADHFFQPLSMWQRACQLRGVDLSRVNLVDAGDPAAIDRAFRAGQGDFVHMQGPAPQLLEHEGIGRVVASVGEVVGRVVFSTLCASPAWLRTDVARRFTRAFRASRARALVAPPHEIAEQIAGFLPGVDHGVLARTIATYQALRIWDGDIAITRELYDATVDVFEATGYLAGRPRYEDVTAAPPV